MKSIRKILSLLLWSLGASAAVQAEDIHPISIHDVIWTTLGKNSSDSMPLGNGSLGINLWVEENGDLLFYLGRNDTLSEISQLCKAGMVRVSLTPNPFLAGAPFRQHLKLRDGVCEITAGAPGKEVRLKVFVDSAAPVVHVIGNSDQPLAVTAKVESWRLEPQSVPDESAWTLAKGPQKITQAADIFPKAGKNSVAWYHRNEHAFAFEETVRVQSLESIRNTMKDPLLHRTFGGWITAVGFESGDERTLATSKPVGKFHLRVASPCDQTPTAEAWLKSAESIANGAEDGDAAHGRTSASWRAFWDRSWVSCAIGPADGLDAKAIASLSPTGKTRHGLFRGQDKVASDIGSMTVGKAHTLQRYMQACAGRSVFPIKFNGSIFTVEPAPLGIKGNPDWRRWGDCHWWQNVRMPYHAMQAAGDFDLMMPLFDTFERIRPFAEARAKLYHKVEGCYFAETMTVWGTYANRDYGWDRNGKHPSDVDCKYWRFAWNQGLELVGLMLDYYEYTGDQVFLRERLLPMAASVLRYFDTRFRKDGDGRIILDPTQSVETYWFDVINDTPTVAGLIDVSSRLCALPEDLVSADQRQFFTRMKAAAPVIPIEDAQLGGRTVRRIGVAQKYNPKRSNCENPELFPIWPFRIFGLERPMLDEARNAYQLRGSHNDVGWGYDGNAAPLLGMTDEAARILKVKIANSNRAYRWPATWGPNFDWLPDQCHGGNLMATINYMLLQHSGDKILILPAWPKDWDVSFKLHAPRRTTVEVVYRSGKIEKLEVSPKERLKDITLPVGIEY
ncbi:MAG TPA: DUF5703 domain-containing protein [Luteolibacter sp.]|nr:DUF5703 domain-containing protein [Luteolibacter sp.]